MAKGLTEWEAAARLARDGENVLQEKGHRRPLALFLRQFQDVLILLLALATLLSVAVGQIAEALSIVAILLLNAVMGFVQEWRTERSMQALKAMSAPTARVWRAGTLRQLPAAKLVRGDVIELRAGDRVPADGCILHGAGMCTDESILSGESAGVKKGGKDRNVYMGTGVLEGHCTAEVTAVGMDTAMGHIAALLDGTTEGPTPLQKRLSALGRFIAATCLVCACLVVGLGLLRGEEPLTLVLTGVSLAVAAIPEGLPAIVTVVLALSVNRILGRGAVIRRLHAVETLGSATVICTDKTGTLTENRMTVTALYCDGRRLDLEDIRLQKEKIDAGVRRALTAACVCNGATLFTDSSGSVRGEGSPTETALLLAAHRLGVQRPAGLKILSEQPFDPARKRMSVYVQQGDARCLYAKGAPDILLPLCERICTEKGVRPMTAADRRRIRARTEELAAQALRVIALAQGEREAEEKLIFLGLAAMADPPRKEVPAAVARCRQAGIRPVMITGDHLHTARAVAKQTGILQGDEGVLEGRQLDAMSDGELAQAAEHTAVFARVTPAHKLRIVEALQSRGHICAMTGDGVNDAPAVKQADIGVAMGSGSEVTREAAGVVVLDDNFATVVAAVEEGRIIYRNIRRFVRFLLTSNLGEVLTVVLAMMMGMPAVFSPVQLLLINLVTDGLPAIALGMEPALEDVMRLPPRDPREGLFAGGLGWTVVFRGAVLGLCNVLSFSAVLGMTGDLAVARSAAYMTLILAQMVHVFECRYTKGSGLAFLRLRHNPVLAAACAVALGVTAAAVYLPGLQGVFGTAAVTGRALWTALGCVVLSPLCGGLCAALSREKRAA